MKNKQAFCAILLALTFLQATSYSDEKEKLGDIIDAGSFRAGAEVRYQGEMSEKYSQEVSGWSKWSLIASAISLLFTAVFSFLSGKLWPKWWPPVLTVISIIASAVGLLCSIRSDDSTASARRLDHIVLEQRWEALKGEWDRLDIIQGTMSGDELKVLVTNLMAQETSLKNAEPRERDLEAYDRAWVTEAQVRGRDIPPKPDPTKQASK